MKYRVFTSPVVPQKLVVPAEVRIMHRWPNAPDEAFFLRSWHRHLLKITFGLAYSIDTSSDGMPDRGVEFFQLQTMLRQSARNVLTLFHSEVSLPADAPGDLDPADPLYYVEQSCEGIAHRICMDMISLMEADSAILDFLHTRLTYFVECSVSEDGECTGSSSLSRSFTRIE